MWKKEENSSRKKKDEYECRQQGGGEVVKTPTKVRLCGKKKWVTRCDKW